MECTRKFHLVLLLLLKCMTVTSQMDTTAARETTAAPETTTAPTTTETTSAPTTTTTAAPTTTVGPGGTCKEDKECAGNMTCVNVTVGKGVCGCNASYYQDNTNCLTKLQPDDTCVNTTQCAGTMTCEDKKCGCSVIKYLNGTTCMDRLGYSVSCTTDNMCQANFSCSGPDSGKKCSCPPDTFREGTSCKNKNSLTVTITMNGDHMETEVRLNWSQPTTGNAVRYTAVLGSHIKNSTEQYANFDNLTPGTEYSVHVTAYVQKETFEPDTIDFTSTQKVYTKPAQPGQLEQDTYVGTNNTDGRRDVTIAFNSSVGRVERYTVTITPSNKTVTIVNMNQSVVNASFTNLTPDTTYTVTITATSNNISSVMRTGSFRVPATPAGEVFQLTVPEIGSRSVRVTWKKPANPNGVIQGYTVRVKMLGNPSCVAGVSVRCSNCTYNNTLQNKPDTSDCKAALPEILKTSAELNNTELFLDVNVTGLFPDLAYDVNVVAFNQAGRGMEGSPAPCKTGQEAAENLTGLTVTSPALYSLKVMWTPGVRTGPTSYNVIWAEQMSLGSDEFSETGSTIVQGYDNQTYTIPNLLSYWNYSVSVRPNASLGQSPNSTVTYSRTLDTEPGELEVFNISQPSDSAQTLTLTVSCPEERKRNGLITAIYYNSTNIGEGSPGPSDKLLKTCPTVSEPVTVTFNAETNYTINVFAFTSTNKTGRLRSKTVHVEPKAPKLTQAESIQKSNELASLTSYNITVCRCLANSSQGKITFVSLVVCKDNKSDCEPAATEQIYRNLTTWKEFKDGGYLGRYRPTPDDWITSLSPAGSRRKRSVQSELQRVARAVSERVGYSIGSDTTCDPATKRSYCNGPLPPDTQLFVYAVACTRGGCSATGLISITTLPHPPDNGVNVGAIVGGIIGALVGIAIVVVVVIFVIRRKPFRSYDRPKRISDHEPDIMKPVRRKPVKLKDFAAHLDRLHKDSNLLFQEEFEEVQENSPKHFANDAACLDANKVKNRYVNILPFDHTRVKLNCDDDEEFSDFINANYIPGYSSPREYIATQGPIACTIDDFWRMIWEQKSSIIVMLSDLSEKGRAKVELYWPTEVNSPVQYGDIIVELTADSTLNKSTIRNFKILIEHQEERRVTQYFVPGWEDYGANLKPDDLLDFIGMVRTEARSSQGPITVHCSAGVGRTGTFIALDFLMQFVKDHNLDSEVDIYNLVINMRHNRPHMVQSEKQYVFIHDALQMIIDRKIRAMQEAESENLYQNTNFQENVYANQAFESDDNLYENSSSLKKPTTSL